MTLIKKSDVHRHTSTKSRADRKIDRPYGAKANPVKSEPVSAKVKAEETSAPPKK
jgi:hypothetical protein